MRWKEKDIYATAKIMLQNSQKIGGQNQVEVTIQDSDGEDLGAEIHSSGPSSNSDTTLSCQSFPMMPNSTSIQQSKRNSGVVSEIPSGPSTLSTSISELPFRTFGPSSIPEASSVTQRVNTVHYKTNVQALKALGTASDKIIEETVDDDEPLFAEEPVVPTVQSPQKRKIDFLSQASISQQVTGEKRIVNEKGDDAAIFFAKEPVVPTLQSQRKRKVDSLPEASMSHQVIGENKIIDEKLDDAEPLSNIPTLQSTRKKKLDGLSQASNSHQISGEESIVVDFCR